MTQVTRAQQNYLRNMKSETQDFVPVSSPARLSSKDRTLEDEIFRLRDSLKNEQVKNARLEAELASAPVIDERSLENDDVYFIVLRRGSTGSTHGERYKTMEDAEARARELATKSMLSTPNSTSYVVMKAVREVFVRGRNG